MAYKLADRMQQILLPPIIDDYVGPQEPMSTIASPKKRLKKC